MAQDVTTIVTRLEAEQRKCFYQNLGKLKILVDQRWDHKKPNPAWMEIEDAFAELRSDFVTWQAFKAALDIQREED
jgi:hypothetical protein